MNLYIDSDSLLYRASHLVTAKVDEALREAELIEAEDGEEELDLSSADSVDTLIAMTKIFHSMAEEIVTAVKNKHSIDEVIYVLTVKPKLECCKYMEDNYRYDIMYNVPDEAVKGYKANRAGMAVPDGLNDIYEYVFNHPQTICIPGIEADDLVVRMGREGHLVSALDKDVIGSLEYSYNYGKKEWIENSEESVAKFPFLQTIMGDTSDGLRGVYRVGSKGANKALADVSHTDEYAMWGAVVKQYALKDQTIEEAVATMRCVRMDQWTEENGLVLWNPPRKGAKQ